MSKASGYRSDVPHGLMFHRFCDDASADRQQGTLSSRDFEAILTYAGIDRILTPQEWLERVVEGRLQDRDLCITFDDGLRSQQDIALPVLEHHGLRAFWFVYSSVFEGSAVRSEIYSDVARATGGMARLIGEFLERCPNELLRQLESGAFAAYAASMQAAAPFYSAADLKYRFLRNQPQNRELFESLMDRIVAERGFELADVAAGLWLADEDLKVLAAKGNRIGLHSYDHPYELASLSREEQLAQYSRNGEHVRRATGIAPDSMSHPLNSYGAGTLSILRELGIRCGFRANMVAMQNRSALELAREDSSRLRALSQQRIH